VETIITENLHLLEKSVIEMKVINEHDRGSIKLRTRIILPRRKNLGHLINLTANTV
jgi:hypothetical protein